MPATWHLKFPWSTPLNGAPTVFASARSMCSLTRLARLTSCSPKKGSSPWCTPPPE